MRKYIRVSVFFLVFAAGFSSLTFASDWTLFRGDEKRTGYIATSYPPPLALFWQASVGGGIISSPIKVGNKIIFGSQDKNIYAFDAFNGTEIWRFPTNGFVESTPAYKDGYVFIGSLDGYIYALDAEKGTLKYKFNANGEILSSPLIYNNYVYFGAGYPSHSVYALNTLSGSQIWKYQAAQPVFSSAAVLNNTIYIGANDGKLYFLDASSGALKATFASNGSVYISTPAIDNEKVFFVGGDYNKNIYGIDAVTGSEIWRHSLGGSDQFVKVSSPAVDGTTVYISAGYPVQKLYAIDKSNGNLKWQYNLGNFSDWNYLSSPVVANNVVYVGSASGKLVALNAGDGSLLFEYALQGSVISSVSVSSGMLYVGTTSGNLYAFSLEQGTTPTALISYPTNNQVVGKNVEISGTAADTYFKRYVLSYTTTSGQANEINTSYFEVSDNLLAIWDTSSVLPGSYMVRLEVFGVGKNISTQEVSVIIDNVPPPLTLDSPQDGLNTNLKDVTVSGTTEAGATVTVNGTSVTLDSQWKFSTTVSLSEGENTITAVAKDSLNNETIVTRKATLDTTPPALTLTSPVDGLLTNQENVTVDGTTEVGATATMNGTSVTVDAEGKFSTGVKLSLGANTITVEAKDAIGNAVSKSVKASYDPNAPSLEITYPTDNLLTNSKDLTVIGKTEVGSTLTINEASVTVDAEGKFTYTLTLAEGENTITLISSDSLGNKITASRKVTLDSKIPELVVDAPEDGMITNQTKLIVAGKAENTATLKVNDEVVTINSDGIFSYELTLKDGENTINVVASDAASNSITITRKVTLDIQPPTGSIALVSDGKTKGNYVMTKEVALKLEAQDNLKVTQAAYALSSDLSSSWKEFTESPVEVTLSLGECCGDKTVYVQYKDSAGNVSDADTSAEGSQPYTVTFTYVKDVKTVSLSVPGTNPELVDLGPVKIDMETVSAMGDLNFVLNKSSFENADGAAESLELRLEFYNAAGKKSGEETLGRVVTWLYFKYDDAYKGAPIANESALAVYRYNSKGEWERLSGFQEVDTSGNTVKALVPLVLNRNYTFQLVHEKSVAPDAVSVLNYPNPVHGDTTFSYSVSSGIPDSVSIEVYSINGKKVLTMNVPPPFTGKFTTEEVDKLPNGVYMYRIYISVSGKTLTKMGKLVLLQ